MRHRGLLVAFLAAGLLIGVLPIAANAVPASCLSDADCSDGRFCTGVERCDLRRARCQLTVPFPCAAGDCNEAFDVCESTCDSDGDGVRAINCGGTDCDDHDANRFPGNTEDCQPPSNPEKLDTHDEDCDSSTFASRIPRAQEDADGDGHVSQQCCNIRLTKSGPTPRCGDDCDDHDPAAHGNSAEVCDHVDNNCNGEIDEGVTVDTFADADGDKHGIGSGSPGCPNDPNKALVGNDCDDTKPAIQPGALLCDPSAANGLKICSPFGEDDGSLVPGICPSGTQCVPQPNGTGRCQVVGIIITPEHL